MERICGIKMMFAEKFRLFIEKCKSEFFEQRVERVYFANSVKGALLIFLKYFRFREFFFESSRNKSAEAGLNWHNIELIHAL